MTDSAQTVELLRQAVELLTAILAALQNGAAQNSHDLTSAVKAAGDAAITYKLLFPH